MAKKPRMAKLRDAAVYARTPVGTMRGWIRRDLLPAYRMGPRLIQVDLNDVDRLRAKRETKRPIGLDVELARQRITLYGPPWRYVSAPSNEVLHLTTDSLVQHAQAICGADLDMATLSEELTIGGKKATCLVCAFRPQILDLYLQAAGRTSHCRKAPPPPAT
jgi:hypothetical protein